MSTEPPISKYIDHDTNWLIEQAKDADLPHSRQLVDLILARSRQCIADQSLPFTIGLFGPWGSGKTTLLAQLASKLQQSKEEVFFYFNAYKFAGFMEIVPALIYRLLQYAPKSVSHTLRDEALEITVDLFKHHSKQFGEWTEKNVGVNAAELVEHVQHASQGQLNAREIKEYYCKVDRIQDLLAQIFPAGKTKPIFVLVDELDRCDPGEAFDVIKQLRILFCMRNVPIVFVVGVNPEPIGHAIQHKFGLPKDGSDYESRRILEKFVDIAIEMPSTSNLTQLILDWWQLNQIAPGQTNILIDWDEPHWKANTASDRGPNSVPTAFDAITLSNPFYSNLRLLQKTLTHAASYRFSKHTWAIWHLELLKQIDPSFRRDLVTIEEEVCGAISRAYADLLSIGQAQLSTEQSKVSITTPEYGAGAYANFRVIFKRRFRQKESENKYMSDAQRAVFARILFDSSRMEFLTNLCGLNVSRNGLIFNASVDSLEKASSDGPVLMRDFQWNLKTL